MEINKERVKEFLKREEGTIRIDTKISFGKYTKNGFIEDIPDKIYTRNLITTMSQTNIKTRASIFDITFRTIARKILDVFQEVTGEKLTKSDIKKIYNLKDKE